MNKDEAMAPRQSQKGDLGFETKEDASPEPIGYNHALNLFNLRQTGIHKSNAHTIIAWNDEEDFD